jgi:hypothetical protein
MATKKSPKPPATELKVHPAADIFPMMSDEELADLAEDIKENGLLHPLVIDAEGQLIDGRNRHAACKLAGIEPRFESLNGHDPLAYIASANLKRRNLTKGQQAMALAMLYPDEPERGRGKKDPVKDELNSSFSYRRLQQAREVLAFSRPLAESVIAGKPLNEALQKVENEHKEADSENEQLDRLRRLAPDLMTLVEEERMPLDEAIAAYDKRESNRRAIYREGVAALARLEHFSNAVLAIIIGAGARIDSDEPIVVTDEAFKEAKDALARLKKYKEGKINAPE